MSLAAKLARLSRLQEELNLVAGPVAGQAALARTAGKAKNAAAIAALVPIAQRLADSSAAGITVTNLRRAGIKAGILTGFEKGKALSYLGAVMKAAGLRPAGHRRSDLNASHGNLQVVWVRP